MADVSRSMTSNEWPKPTTRNDLKNVSTAMWAGSVCDCVRANDEPDHWKTKTDEPEATASSGVVEYVP